VSLAHPGWRLTRLSALTRRAARGSAGPAATFVRLARTGVLVVMVALAATALVSAGIPPALDEDRSEPGFCSPDCPLQEHATHSVAVAPDLSMRGAPTERPRQAPSVFPTRIHPAVTVALDAPRAPPAA
jgi:hypothetical protein